MPRSGLSALDGTRSAPACLSRFGVGGRGWESFLRGAGQAHPCSCCTVCSAPTKPQVTPRREALVSLYPSFLPIQTKQFKSWQGLPGRESSYPGAAAVAGVQEWVEGAPSPGKLSICPPRFSAPGSLGHLAAFSLLSSSAYSCLTQHSDACAAWAVPVVNSPLRVHTWPFIPAVSDPSPLCSSPLYSFKALKSYVYIG